MSQIAANISKVANVNTALDRAVIALLGGDPEKSATSALYVFLGRLLFGKQTGLTKDGKPVEVDDELYYERHDRDVPIQIEDTEDKKKKRIFQNLVRAYMVHAIGTYLKVIAFLVMPFAIYGVYSIGMGILSGGYSMGNTAVGVMAMLVFVVASAVFKHEE